MRERKIERGKEETLYLLLMGMRSSSVRCNFSEELMLALTEVWMKTYLLHTNLFFTIHCSATIVINNSIFAVLFLIYVVIFYKGNVSKCWFKLRRIF